MATPLYSWAPTLRLISGGYPGENPGTIPETPTTVTTSATSGQSTYQCYYRDSVKAQNCSSTRVLMTGHDEWEILGVDQYNVMTVEVHTRIESIVRDDKVETCGAIPPRQGNTADYVIRLRRTETSPILWDSGNVYIGAMGTILANYDLGRTILRIPPGDNNGQPTMYLESHYAPGLNLPDEKYHDIFQIGLRFTNLLPVVYRPGEVWDGSTYLSHNRSGGARNIWTGGSWQECTTMNGPNGSDNPPTIWNGSRNENMRLIGQGG